MDHLYMENTENEKPKLPQLVPVRKVVYGTRKLFYPFDFYKLRLVPCRRYQKVFYKIAVTNRNNRIIEFVGFINPHAVPLRLSYRDLENFSFEVKQIGIDRSRVMFWLSKKVLTILFVFFFLFEIGLMKTYYPLSVGRYCELFPEYVELFCSEDFQIAFIGLTLTDLCVKGLSENLSGIISFGAHYRRISSSIEAKRKAKEEEEKKKLKEE